MSHSLNLEQPKAKRPKLKITPTGVCITAMLLLSLLVGIVPQFYLAIAVLGCAVVLVFTRDIWMAFPIMIFYYQSFGVLFGMSVYRYFTFLFLFYIIVNCIKIPINLSHLLLLVVFSIYCLVIIASDDLRRALFVILDVLCIVLLVNCFLNNVEALKSFFRVYVFTALCSFVTGAVVSTARVIDQVLGGEVVEVVRNYGTFEDPNYMGLFFSVAVFAMMSLSLFRPWVRAILAVTLTIMIFTTLSVTALVLNAVFWLVYLFIYRKINIVTLCCIAIVLFALLGLYSYGLENPDTPVIGVFSLRIHEKLNELSYGNINDVTTGRTDLTLYHWEYFSNQSFGKMLFGMNAASTLKTDLDGFTGVGHNEYVDLLLNVGLFGAILFLGVFLKRAVKMFWRVRKDRDAYSGCIFMLKVIWLGYAFTLTMFGDYRFMMLFFI